MQESLVYVAFKFIHILGVILLLGNVTATAIWKVFANRTSNVTTIAFAQRLVTYTDWSLTVTGVVLVMVGGYGMAIPAQLALDQGWLLWSQVLFALSGMVWLFRLIPIQIRQARLAELLCDELVATEYRQLCRGWIAWGSIATVPLVAVTWLMVAKG